MLYILIIAFGPPWHKIFCMAKVLSFQENTFVLFAAFVECYSVLKKKKENKKKQKKNSRLYVADVVRVTSQWGFMACQPLSLIQCPFLFIHM